MDQSKTCPCCREAKPLEAFSRSSRGVKDGRQTYCRACCSAKKRAYREVHGDKLRERARLRARGRPILPPDPDALKVCFTCGEAKPHADFRASRVTTDGRLSSCRECGKAYKEKWRKDNVERRRAKERFLLYGLTVVDHAAMLAAQDGKCAICGQLPTGKAILHVDHDHVTGRVRGLLCRPCNHGVGHFSDDIDRIRRAADYLEAAADKDQGG